MSETEGNETFTTADKITAGTKIKGQLASSTDVDYFKYTTSGAASLNLSYDLPTSSNTDYFSVQILDSNNNILSGVGTGKDGTLKASVTEAGTYYIGVSVDGYYHDSGQYGLTLNENAFTGDYESEPNHGSNSYGDVLTSNQKMSGQLYDSSDVDFYYIKATQSGALRVNFDTPTDSNTDYFKVPFLYQTKLLSF